MDLEKRTEAGRCGGREGDVDSGVELYCVLCPVAVGLGHASQCRRRRLDDEVVDRRLSARNDKYINRLRRHLDEIVDRYLPLLTPQHAAQ